MAAGLATATANSALGTANASAEYIQLHTGDPGSDGTANVSSVTTREAVTWNDADDGSVTASNEPEWTDWGGDNGEEITYISFWDESSDGDFQFSMQLSNSVTMGTGDSLTLTSLTVTFPTAS